jgi:hypothetical protein
MMETTMVETDAALLQRQLEEAEAADDFVRAETVHARLLQLGSLPGLEAQKEQLKRDKNYRAAAEVKLQICQILGGHKSGYASVCGEGCEHVLKCSWDSSSHWTCCGQLDQTAQCAQVRLGDTFELKRVLKVENVRLAAGSIACLALAPAGCSPGFLVDYPAGQNLIAISFDALKPREAPWDPTHTGSFRFMSTQEHGAAVLTGPAQGEPLYVWCDDECKHALVPLKASHWPCCGQRHLRDPCEPVIWSKPDVGFGDRVVLNNGVRGQVVLVDHSDDYCYQVRTQQGDFLWTAAAHLAEKLPPPFLDQHTGDFRDVHTSFIAYGPHAGAHFEHECGEAGDPVCECQHDRTQRTRKAHWSCCGRRLQDECKAEHQPKREAELVDVDVSDSDLEDGELSELMQKLLDEVDEAAHKKQEL